jgi:WD40 repeat protein
MRFFPNGRALATTGGGAHEVTLWDIADPTHPTARGVLPLLQGDPPAKYTPLAFTPDSAILATTEPTGLVSLWNVADLDHPSRVSTVDTTATQGGRMGLVDNSVELVIPPGGHTLITVMNNQKASVWDIADASHPRHVSDVIHQDAGPGIFRISPDGHTVVSAARPYRDTINVWTIPAA